MVTDAVWQEKARRLLKGIIKGHGLQYRDLVERLAALGVKDTEQNITNKLSRGGFSAVFLLQVLEAVGCDELSLRHIQGDSVEKK